MKKNLFKLTNAILWFVVSFSLPLKAIDTQNTRLLSQPATNTRHIAFVYAGDIWIGNHDGRSLRRLTSHTGYESNPIFSPDGNLIAFNAQYDGNTDVYIVSSQGGVPKRLSVHPGTDYVCGFTPDGKSVIFRSSRNSFTRRYSQLFSVPIQGGFPQQLKIPRVFKACYSPDGNYIAYVPFAEVYHEWKHYRGGTVTEIRIMDLSDYSIETIPQPRTRCNDTDPVWIGNTIYFRSDRNGEFNIHSFDFTDKTINQLTHFADFPVLDLDGSDNDLIFEQSGYLHLFSLSDNQHQQLKIGVATDLQSIRSRYVKGFDWIGDSQISPSGSRAVLEYRGDIITLPAEKGDPRYLTGSSGIHEHTPAWSPDGKKIAFFSDQSGEYALHILYRDNDNQIEKIKLNGTGFYSGLAWSPDSKKLIFSDNGRNLYWVGIGSGKPGKIVQESIYMPGSFGSFQGSWSPNSEWIAYTLNTESYIKQLYLYSLEKGKSYPITRGMSEVSEPVFDKSGKYLYFFSSTDAGPVKHWFAMSSEDMELNRNLYLLTLSKDIGNPLAKESDEEKIDVQDSDDTKQNEAETKDEICIDLTDIENRIIALPIDEANYRSLASGDEGTIYFLKQNGTQATLHSFSLQDQKVKTLLSGLRSYALSADHKKILYRTGSDLHIVKVADKIESGTGKLNTNAVAVKIDPEKEWKQIFQEAWRINRDYFYDPNFHGCDWKAMKEKYAQFLPHVACRNDLNRIIQWMCSELVVGHHRVGGGDDIIEAETIPGGLLGADYEIDNNRYRFKKVYGGLNWDPDLHSPLKQPGVEVKAGEYLLAVNGKELYTSENIYKRFENTSGTIVSITVGPDPDGKNSRTVDVVPIDSESSLRNRDWVESNIKKVHKATDGRVAYVYVPNTTSLGHTYFKRYFFPQADKDAIIIDERFNGGGQVADYYIDILRRPYICHWNLRYGKDLRTPSAAIHGPKVMLINETAGSGGDLLPWMFRKLDIGTLIGKRTWGGLVGVLGFPMLLDGGYITAPNLAIWTEDGFVVENEGVPPDIEVDQTPKKVIEGQDPQLEKAIEVILKQLEENPPKEYKRPPYPVRVKK
ncbi:MAG: PDZ domain-containing protein [bacterium]